MTWEIIESSYWGACLTQAGSPLPVDPYLVWAEADNFPMLSAYREENLRLLVQLKQTKSASDLNQFANAEGLGSVAPIWLEPLPKSSQQQLDDNRQYNFCVLELDGPKALDGSKALAAAIKNGLGHIVERFVLSNPIAAQKDDEERAEAGLRPLSVDPEETLIGVIDDGCAFAHRDLRNQRGTTRIRAIWDQDGQAPAFRDWISRTRNSHAGAAGVRAELADRTRKFPYGAVIWKPGLDHLIGRFTAHGSVDEQACYLAADYQSAVRRVSHGMHVLSIATGPVSPGARVATSNGSMLAPRSSTGSTNPIVFVQISRSAAADASGAWLGASMLDGLRFILEQTTKKTRRVLVNISYGPQSGPLDGSSPIEEALESLTDYYQQAGMPLQIALPAGNAYQARGRGALTIPPVGQRSLDWEVLPDNGRPSVIEIWVKPESAKTLRVRVLPPNGKPSEWVACGGGLRATSAARTSACTIVFAESVARGRNASMILIAVGPTTQSDSSEGVRAGRWQIQFHNQSTSIQADVDAFVGRGDTNFGTRQRSRQSYLVDRDYDPLRYARASVTDNGKSSVTRSGTLSGIATGEGVTVVGGYRGSDGQPAPYTSAGPTRGGRDGVDISAMSDQSVALHGILGAANRSAGVARFVGTSAAAPQAVRYFARFNSGPHSLPAPPGGRNAADGRLSLTHIPKESP